MNIIIKPSQGLIGEQPRVIDAKGCSMLDHKGHRRFIMLALVRHPDPNMQRAVIESTESLAHCAKALDEQCTSSGIYWNGTYKIATPDQLGILPPTPQIVTG